MLKKALLLFNTVKYLKASQLSNRVKRKFISPKLDFSNTPKISNTDNNVQSFIQSLQKMYGSNSFRFLNKEFILRMPKDWNSENQDKLFLYNLHYFDDLNAINANQRVEWHYDLFKGGLMKTHLQLEMVGSHIHLHCE